MEIPKLTTYNLHLFKLLVAYFAFLKPIIQMTAKLPLSSAIILESALLSALSVPVRITLFLQKVPLNSGKPVH